MPLVFVIIVRVAVVVFRSWKGATCGWRYVDELFFEFVSVDVVLMVVVDLGKERLDCLDQLGVCGQQLSGMGHTCWYSD